MKLIYIGKAEGDKIHINPEHIVTVKTDGVGATEIELSTGEALIIASPVKLVLERLREK